MPQGFPDAQGAQERYDRWICANGTTEQKRWVGTKNGSRVKCGATLEAGNGNNGNTYHYPRQEEVFDYPYEHLGKISRANQKANVFNRSFNPTNRKIVVLLIAGFLLFLAFTGYKEIKLT